MLLMSKRPQICHQGTGIDGGREVLKVLRFVSVVCDEVEGDDQVSILIT